MGLIYKYTNLTNEKIYIGQTKQTMELRHRKHISQLSDDTYFHRAIKKYGINNFKYEIIEDNIPDELLDTKEIYYIDKYNSFYIYGIGYNLTKGGQLGSYHQILLDEEVLEIKKLLKNTSKTFTEIGDLYGVSMYCISDINRGKTFYIENENYPIRKTPKRSILNNEKVNEIIKALQLNKISIKELALIFNINEWTIHCLNQGTSKWSPKNLEYPIRKSVKKSTFNNKLNIEQVIKICYNLIFTNKTQSTIAEVFNVKASTIGEISRGITWKEISNQFKCPMTKNREENKNIYNSIYGIV